MEQMKKDLLTVRTVVRSYGDGANTVAALDGVDLSVRAGEFAALVGPSGSGKTTLLNLIGALDQPDSGEVSVDGENLKTLTPARRSALRLHKLGFVFQSFNLIPVLSALENVEYVLQLQKRPAAERQERAKAMLDAVGLAQHMHRRPDELSGGQQQRVAVARALVGQPLLVLADEPTANLDSDTGEVLLQTMQRLNRELGTTFLFSTHDPMVMRHARRIVRMQDGKITEDSAHDVAQALRT
ncbi:ABC transporter ATP-binding protein [Pseudoduganella namucuonensis]|uniref:Putative ABC transport system ATP-binding protein n=1 Tax=Pseudoduganella namucuonensis TaxID=1035707 RepID=A0A1I7FKI0_9BURK|nr:ABC transporter ATP-binding protein [Pseudoduganella namucuonensis]SFU36655.1 putative ABC transport system ATP-binding protein [Pseudoduganella namucuonensis]